MAEAGRYLYAVTRGLAPESLAEVRGLEDGALGVVEKEGLVAVVSDVDLEVYGEQGLREHLEDLTWLEQVARRHDEVVQAVALLGPTAPLRLATICLDDDGVRARLREWHDALHQALDRVEGRMEWSVKAYAAPRAAGPGPGADASGPARGAGAAYLQRKRTQTDERRAAEEQGVAAASEIHQALGARAVASRLLAAQDPRLTGHEGTMTLNGAYLVAVDDADAFVAETERQAAAHDDVRLEVHGPWPPYSFASLDQP
jgi:hypothetical protein